MNRGNVSEYKLRMAIAKTKEFKSFVALYMERMNCFNDGYYNAVRIKYSFTFKITFSYHHPDWDDKHEKEVYNNSFVFDDTIVASYDFIKKPANALAGLIARHVLDIIRLKDVECYHVVDAIDVECVWWYIDDLEAWSSENVGTYYIEQECGEHWVVLPKEPDVQTRNYINLAD